MTLTWYRASYGFAVAALPVDNGLKSIISHLDSEQFPRIRIGVGDRANPEFDLADFVLGHFSAEEMKQMEQAFTDAIDSAELIVDNNIQEAMNRHN